MTAYASTIPTLKAALYSALQTLAGTPSNALYKVRVGYGLVIHGNPREWVVVGDVKGTQEWAAIGHLRREEDYEVTLLIFVAYEGDDQKATSERAFALADAVAVYLRGDPTVAGTVRVAGFGGGEISLEERTSDDGKRRGALLTATITCKARM